MLHLAVSRSNSLKTQNIFEEGGSQMVEYPQYPSLSFLGGIFVSSSFLIGIQTCSVEFPPPPRSLNTSRGKHISASPSQKHTIPPFFSSPFLMFSPKIHQAGEGGISQYTLLSYNIFPFSFRVHTYFLIAHYQCLKFSSSTYIFTLFFYFLFFLPSFFIFSYTFSPFVFLCTHFPPGGVVWSYSQDTLHS